MERKLLWIDLEKGWIAFEYLNDGKHDHYEYLEIQKISDEPREFPKLEKYGKE
jgi:hypothetical protein